MPEKFPPCVIEFRSDVSAVTVPEKFTYPFYYQPSDLAVKASEQLQKRLLSEPSYRPNLDGLESTAMSEGKMLGVLVVKNDAGQLGFLAGFSGKLNGKSVIDGFVPPIFDPYQQDSFYHQGQIRVNQMNADLNNLIADQNYLSLLAQRDALTKFFKQQEQLQRELIIEGRKQRKAQRLAIERSDESAISQAHKETKLATLAKESVLQKNQLLALKADQQNQLNELEIPIAEFEQAIAQLKADRKSLSHQLQQELFAQYKFLNIKQDAQDLKTVFAAVTDLVPPSGSGDCAAPKLLQYAFLHGLTPVTMAEFWWGKAPRSEIRQHLNYYPACQGKCFPILTHMLCGMELDENLLLKPPSDHCEIEIVYQDEAMAIINKPADLLSVPGKQIKDSVYTRMKSHFPHATGALIVHRLDMATSGLMVIALTPRAHKQLQKQFIERTVTKYYVAIVEGIVEQTSGEITLPLRGDFYDRPRQLVCPEHGKPAHTFFEQLSTDEQRKSTRLKLFPKTGRTHQLRVHCAHELGLNMPIVGDDLYGKPARRLHLHAQQLSLLHPYSKQPMSFEVEPDF